jgi:hypothetical protein
MFGLQRRIEMAKKESYKVIVLRMLLISLVIAGVVALVSCVPGDYNNVEAASAGLSVIPADARAKADAASVARWQGLGQQQALLARVELERGAIATAARWEAAGEFYENRTYAGLARAQAASNARWQAMGEHYGGAAAVTFPEPDSDTARWMAMGEAYRQAGLAGEGG